MFYIAVSSIGDIMIGERLYLMEDSDFDEVSAIRENGEVVGYAASFEIDGCLNKDFIRRFVGKTQGLVCEVVLMSGDVIILSTEGCYQNHPMISEYAFSN